MRRRKEQSNGMGGLPFDSDLPITKWDSDQSCEDGERTATPEKLLTLKQIQEAAGISRPPLYRWRMERGLRMIRVGGCVRGRKSDWLRFIEKYAEAIQSGGGDATAAGKGK